MLKPIDARDVAEILERVQFVPKLRREPLPGDLTGEHFDGWFDGGALTENTGSRTWVFRDGTRVWQAIATLMLHVEIRFPDGTAVSVTSRRPEPQLAPGRPEPDAARRQPQPGTAEAQAADRSGPAALVCCVCGKGIPDGGTYASTPAGPAHVGCVG